MDTLDKFKVISIVGNTKNAGKTTVLNYYLEKFDKPIGLSSIGLDGEEIDQVNFLEKPRIFVDKGYFIATASETLKYFTCKYQIARTTGIFTSIGEVIIVEVTSPGKALIAGPAKVIEMAKIIELLNNEPVEKIIIDGAFSRQIFSRLSQATILVIGANYSNDMNAVVNNARLNIKQLNLNVITDDRLVGQNNICLIDEMNQLERLDYSTVIGNVDAFFKLDFSRVKYVYFPRSITNQFVERLIKERHNVSFDIILDSPTYLQLSDKNLENLFKLKLKIFVTNPINLAAVFYNPFSPRGYEFSNIEFKECLEKALKQKVYNVLKDG
ncbi:MAG: hypothetical protein WCY80_00440 [Candidatus Izemoplasmatales bacterium]